MLIKEIFDINTNDWEYAGEDTYTIYVNDSEYIQLNFVQYYETEKIFDIEFVSFKNDIQNWNGYTNSNMSIKIFSNIADCIRHFYAREHPIGFRFSSKLTDTKRVNLYNKLAEKIAKNINGIVYVEDDTDYRYYLVTTE